MIDNTVDLVRDFEVKTSLGSSSDSPNPSLSVNHTRLEIIALSDDFGLDWASGSP